MNYIEIYRRFMPFLIKDLFYLIYETNLRIRYNKCRPKVVKYLSDLGNDINEEQKQVLNNLLNNTKTFPFPYPFVKEYNFKDVSVYEDSAISLHYVLSDNKRLYFPKDKSTRNIKVSWNGLKIEQDIQSPHCYLNNHINVKEGDVVVDVGAAEGNFSLSIIEKAKKVYIFEADKRWVEALKATFSQWRNKVEIIERYVSNINDNDNVTLDYFFKDKNVKIDFIKVDAEGAEKSILDGACSLLGDNKNLQIAICTYHKKDDDIVLANCLNNLGFKTFFSPGYMLFPSEPYLRRGLIWAYPGELNDVEIRACSKNLKR